MAYEEYRILCDDALVVQQILNQWHHVYDIHILGFSVTNEFTAVLLVRIRKENQKETEQKDK